MPAPTWNTITSALSADGAAPSAVPALASTRAQLAAYGIGTGEVLGRGAFSLVVSAWHGDAPHRRMAAKLLWKTQAPERVKHEIEALTVCTRDVAVIDTAHATVLLVPQAASASLPHLAGAEPACLAGVISDLGLQLAAQHVKHVIHRDFKLSNVAVQLPHAVCVPGVVSWQGCAQDADATALAQAAGEVIATMAMLGQEPAQRLQELAQTLHGGAACVLDFGLAQSTPDILQRCRQAGMPLELPEVRAVRAASADLKKLASASSGSSLPGADDSPAPPAAAEQPCAADVAAVADLERAWPAQPALAAARLKHASSAARLPAALGQAAAAQLDCAAQDARLLPALHAMIAAVGTLPAKEVTQDRAPWAGTAGYRAPETLLDLPLQSAGLDVWGMGIVLCCILSWRTPFIPHEDRATELMAICHLTGWTRALEAAAVQGRALVAVAPVFASASCSPGSPLPPAAVPAQLRTFDCAQLFPQQATIALWAAHLALARATAAGWAPSAADPGAEVAPDVVQSPTQVVLEMPSPAARWRRIAAGVHTLASYVRACGRHDAPVQGEPEEAWLLRDDSLVWTIALLAGGLAAAAASTSAPWQLAGLLWCAAECLDPCVYTRPSAHEVAVMAAAIGAAPSMPAWHTASTAESPSPHATPAPPSAAPDSHRLWADLLAGLVCN